MPSDRASRGGRAADPPPSIPKPGGGLAALYARPGFKLRRAHQIALSVFLEECRAHDVTTTQYGILVALRECPGIDQVGLAQLLGLDRSTTGMVVGLLEARALLKRTQPPEDRRRRLLDPFSAPEAELFNALLDKLLDHHDAEVRVPLMRPQR